MSTQSTPPSPEQRRAALSALMDGDAELCDAACRFWRSDGTARAEWHTYHLIGDLMRSEEHRADAGHDARLLARVRERLAREPVVLAPTPTVAPAAAFVQKRRARSWMVPTAVAAGFVAVTGALLVMQVSAPDPAQGAGVVASSSVAPTPVLRPAAVSTPASPVAPVTMIRNPELDRYLAAHRQYASGALQAAPGGVVRQAAAAAPGR